MEQTKDLSSAAVAVLTTAEATEKARLTTAMAAAWRAGRLEPGGSARPPIRPARPPRPELLPPRLVPRRRIGPAPEGRIALLHALAHIELNAVDRLGKESDTWTVEVERDTEGPEAPRVEWSRGDG